MSDEYFILRYRRQDGRFGPYITERIFSTRSDAMNPGSEIKTGPGRNASHIGEALAPLDAVELITCRVIERVEL